MFSKRGKGIILGILIVGQLFCVFHFGARKCGYHMDELFTYGLSNSYYKPVPSDAEQWLDSSYFQDYLETSPQDSFSYGSVYYNQTQDVHPPLYYFLIHTICSFFPHTFSKWFGIGLNMIFSAGNSIVLFLLSRRVLKSDWLALLVCAFWGLSVAAFSIGIFIRMYMMLSFWVVLFAYLLASAVLQPDGKNPKRRYIGLGAVAFLGTITQYFFGIYLVFASLCAFLYLGRSGRKREKILLMGSVLTAMALAVAVFPACLQQIFMSGRGQETIGDLFTPQNFFHRILEYTQVLNRTLFGGILLYLLCGVIILAGIAYFAKKRGLKPSSGWGIPLLIFLPALGYFLFVSLAAPFIEIRYVFPVFSLFALSFVGGVAFLARSCLPAGGVAFSLPGLVAGVLLLGLCTQPVSFQYRDYVQTAKQLSEYAGARCLLIASAPWEMVGSAEELANYSAIYFHQADSDHFSLPSAQDLGASQTLLLYLGKEYHQERALKTIHQQTQWKQAKQVCETDYFEIYALSGR